MFSHLSRTVVYMSIYWHILRQCRVVHKFPTVVHNFSIP